MIGVLAKGVLARALALALLLLGSAHAAKKKTAKLEPSLIKQDITIKSKSVGGPAVAVPPPSADPAVLKEVIESLDVYRNEQRAATGLVRLDTTRRRLERPFPEAPFLVFSPRLVAERFDRWVFEVLDGSRVLWQTSGAGRFNDRVEWDGTDSSGRLLAKVGPEYRFRFSGSKHGETFNLESETILLRSLSFREFMGEQHLEVDHSLLFAPERAALEPTASEYLEVMAERMRRASVKDKPYRLVLYQKAPQGALAKDRARTLTRFFAKRLVIAASRVAVELRTTGDRGQVAACVLPPEKGSSIRDNR